MNVVHTTPLQVARLLFRDVHEYPGAEDHPLIMAALRMAAPWPQHDEVSWCSAVPFLVHTALGLPVPDPTMNLRARSWLTVGQPIPADWAWAGSDLAIFAVEDGAPGPDVIEAPGHVGWFWRHKDQDRIELWGGNQSDGFNLSTFPTRRLLGIRRFP